MLLMTTGSDYHAVNVNNRDEDPKGAPTFTVHARREGGRDASAEAMSMYRLCIQSQKRTCPVSTTGCPGLN